MNLNHQTITNISKLLSNGEITSVELTEACLNQIESFDNSINAFISVYSDMAIQQAYTADKAWLNWRKGNTKIKPSMINGVPIAIKDVLCMSDTITSAGSKMLQNFVSHYDATAVAHLRNAGAVLIGKTNTDEFAMGSSTETSIFGPTHNPWNIEHVPGGSSGGSAASVSSQMVYGALGTDTGGSVRQPAAMCGVVGFKPTYGGVSRSGLIAFGSSFDQIGTITKTVEDSAALHQAICGHDPHDLTSYVHKNASYFTNLSDCNNLNGITIGVDETQFNQNIQPEVKLNIMNVLETIKNLGANIIPIHLPHNQYALESYYLIANAEASANLARYDRIRYGFRSNDTTLMDTYINTRSNGLGKEVKRRIMLGTYALSTGYYDDYYLNAQKIRSLISEDFSEAFSKVDLIVGPVTPTTAFKIGAKINNPLQMYLSDVFTLSANLAGLPGISIPCGFDKIGLPIGVQMLGPKFSDQKLFNVAHIYQQTLNWRQFHPSLENKK